MKNKSIVRFVLFSLLLVFVSIGKSSAHNKVVVVPLLGDDPSCGSNKDPDVICTSGLDQFVLPLRMSLACNPNLMVRTDKYLEIYPDQDGYWQSLKLVPSQPTKSHLHVSMYWQPSSIPSTTGIIIVSIDKIEQGFGTQNIYLFQDFNITCNNIVAISSGPRTPEDIWRQGENWDLRPLADLSGPSFSLILRGILFRRF